MAQTVVGLFENETDAQRAAEQLEAAGIGRGNVDVSRSDKYTTGQNVSNEEGGNAVSRFFKNLFGDSDDANRYSKLSSNGNYSIVTVHAESSDEAERAADLLDDLGAVNVDERSAQYDSQSISGERSASDSDRSTSDSGNTISRVQEELQVGKREVESGGVRVRSRIVEKPVEETLRLREEHVTVQRNPVDRPLTENDRTAFQEQNIELTERAEVPVVSKEARVVEEIRISKDVDERTETIRDTVRNTEVDVENIEGGKRSASDDASLGNTAFRDSDNLNRGTGESRSL